MAIERKQIERLVLESLVAQVKEVQQYRMRSADPPAPAVTKNLQTDLWKRVEKEGLVPPGTGPSSCQGAVNRIAADVLWDLAIQRVLTAGVDLGDLGLPEFTVTPYGEGVLTQTQPTYYDPDGYLTHIDSLCPGLDPVMKEYVKEGLACMRAGLVFAAAVMFGAAAEKAILLLVEALANATTDAKKAKHLQNLLNGQSVPPRYVAIEQTCADAITNNLIPNNVHQGSIARIICIFDMIRVQRNDAVHPKTATCNRENVLTTIQAFPNALRVIYLLIDWLSKNKI
ncbi:MAG: hypothetical protein JW759_09620 [Candidatus Coatesbacteria bacterium]|nr:hypothetical protein [Candidatus Coatesbacteria bacterium]